MSMPATLELVYRIQLVIGEEVWQVISTPPMLLFYGRRGRMLAYAIVYVDDITVVYHSQDDDSTEDATRASYTTV